MPDVRRIRQHQRPFLRNAEARRPFATVGGLLSDSDTGCKAVGVDTDMLRRRCVSRRNKHRRIRSFQRRIVVTTSRRFGIHVLTRAVVRIRRRSPGRSRSPTWWVSPPTCCVSAPPAFRPTIPPPCVQRQDRVDLCRICSSLFPSQPLFLLQRACSILLACDLILNLLPALFPLRDGERLYGWPRSAESDYQVSC